MRCLTLFALLTCTCFAQQPTPWAQTAGRATLHVARPAAVGTQRAQQAKFDPNTPQICIELRTLTARPEDLATMKAGQFVRAQPVAVKPGPPAISDEELRSSGGIQLVTATRVVEQKQPVFVRRLSDKQAFELLRGAQRNERVNMLFAPKVTLFDSQEAEISDTTQRPFVVALTRTDRGVEPVVQVHEDGVRTAVRATVKKGRVRLDVAITHSDITSVETRNVGTDERKVHRVQLPKVKTDKVQLSAIVEDGGTLAICGFRRMREVRKEQPILGGKVPVISGMFKNVGIAREPEELVWLITPRVIVPGDEELNLSELTGSGHSVVRN